MKQKEMGEGHKNLTLGLFLILSFIAISSGVSGLFMSSMNSLAASPLRTGVGAIGFAISSPPISRSVFRQRLDAADYMTRKRIHYNFIDSLHDRLNDYHQNQGIARHCSVERKRNVEKRVETFAEKR